MEEEEVQPLLPPKPKTRNVPAEANVYIRLVKPCVAEFLMTAIFVFAGTTSVHTENLLLIAMVHGITIYWLIQCFGDLSGGHINPAVTVAVFLGSSMHFAQAVKALCYIVSQLTGSLVGAGLTRAVLWFPIKNGSNETVYEMIGGGTHVLTPGLSVGQGYLIEVIMTFVLCQTVLMTAVDRGSPFAPLAIGFTVFVDIALGATLTGASMNPARSFGPAVVISNITTEPWTNHYIYWIGPFTGAVIAAFLYRSFFASGSNQLFVKLRNQPEAAVNADVDSITRDP